MNNYEKCSIFHNVSGSGDTPKPLAELAYAFGDSSLKEMEPESKLHLLAILAQWQAVDTQQEGSYGLVDSFYGYAMFDDLPGEVEQAIVSLQGLTDDDCFSLMVALSLQIKHGVYAE